MGSKVASVLGRHRAKTGLGHPRAQADSPLRSAPHKTGVVSDVGVVTGLAAHHVTTERCRAAVFNGRHDLELPEADVAGVGFPPSRAVGAEDIRDLQGRASHHRRLSRRGERQILQGAFYFA